MKTRTTTARVELYQCLAEALSEPAGWLARPGIQWPLFQAAVQVASAENNDAVRESIVNLATIPRESLKRRHHRYRMIAETSQSPMIESLARDGRLAGPLSLAVWSVYRTVGLDVAGMEQPDHVSVELAFLAYLTQQELTGGDDAIQWRKARRLFIKRHAGQWMPSLGATLKKTGDPVYGPIGALLSAAVQSDLRPSRRKKRPKSAHRVPALAQPDNCNLCSFCVQVCPTQALIINETSEATALVLNDDRCVSCNKCANVCPTQTLQLGIAPPDRGVHPLYESRRARCPICGEPTVSEAELNEISQHIGTPGWLHYCLNCR